MLELLFVVWTKSNIQNAGRSRIKQIQRTSEDLLLQLVQFVDEASSSNQLEHAAES